MAGWKGLLSEWPDPRRPAVLALPVLPLRRYGRVAAAQDGDVLLSVSLGPAGEAVALWSAPADQKALTALTAQPGVAFPDARTGRPPAVRITVQFPDVASVLRIAAMPLAHITAQPLPGGRVLVVATRCRWRPEGPDRNAMVYEADGTVAAEYCFGDGVEHVLATPSGRVWVGYSDEGFDRDHGWDAAGIEPLGSCGLARFGPDGLRDWRFPSGDAPVIVDCYALNVTGETAWACYESDFPLVQVQDGQVTVRRNGLSDGPRGLIVKDQRVALVGGYLAYRDLLVVGDLRGGELREAGRYRLVLPDGEPLPHWVRIIGRGSDVHVFHGTDWYRLSLDDIPPGR